MSAEPAPEVEKTEDGDLLAELDCAISIDNTAYTANVTFEDLRDKNGLSQTLLDNLYKKGFKRPSKIQGAALPIVLNKEKGKRNIIAQGQSGTGKTATYVLGMYNIVSPSRPDFKAICLEPTRELARQTFDVCLQLSEGTGIASKLLIPGTKLRKRQVLPELVFVGTPGFVLNAIEGGSINPKNVLMLAIDEADAMLQDRLGEQTLRIKQSLPSGAKVTLFSATFPDEVKEFAAKVCPDATEIRLKPSEVMLNRIMQLNCHVDEKHDKYSLVRSVFRTLSVGQAFIFTNTIRTCEELSKRMMEDGFSVSMLHGRLSNEDRDKVIDMFKKGKSRVLVSTNVISRGIDVLQVSLVINYDVPLHGKSDDKGEAEREVDTETYIHRIGRTARFGRSGVALTLVATEEDEEKLDEILSNISCESPEIKPEQLGEIEELLKRCRSRDKENLKRLDLESTTLPAVEAKDAFVPERHRHGKGAKPAASSAAPSAAPSAASSAAPSAAPAKQEAAPSDAKPKPEAH